ncbi:type I methionyl aminopeptidase [Candidatus Microgenomates bacterium]|nr:type I methionyl aminopeptidase [Candidatus Microgenomates bacterium]
MITIKTPKEIQVIAKAGEKLAQVKTVLVEYIKPGVTLLELERIAEGEIDRLGAEPAFKRVKGYKWATCINVNEGLVHGIPTDQKIKPGDKVSIDIGIYYQGWNVDSAFTVGVSPVNSALARFIETGKEALSSGIAQTREDNRVGHISQAIEYVLTREGYSPSRIFTGHGIGKELHEEPAIPCFLHENIDDTPELVPGMVVAVEAIYNEGNPEVIIDKDGWTARTKDGTIGGLFEETVVITDRGPCVLTAIRNES